MRQTLLFVLLAIANVPSVRALGWYEIEPNETCATGTSFTVASGQGGGQLSSASDVDSFRFGSPEIALWTLTAAPIDTTYDGGIVRVRIFDPNGALLAGRGLTSDSAPIPLRALVSSGTYCVQVDQDPTYQIFTKEYLLSASLDDSAAALLSNEAEPNDSIATATSIAPTDPPIWSQLSSSADIDFFRMDTRGGDVLISIDVENRNYDGTSMVATLTDGANTLAGRVVLSDQPAAISLRARRLAPGPLYLRFAQQVGYTAMDKYVTSSVSFQPYPGQIEIEPNNTVRTSTRVEGPGQLIGQLYDATDVDYYKIALTAGVATFQVSPENTNYDGGVILVQIKDQIGNTLAGQQINSDSSPATMNVGVATTGDFFVVVSSVTGYQIFDKNYVISMPTSPPIFANGFEG